MPRDNAEGPNTPTDDDLTAALREYDGDAEALALDLDEIADRLAGEGDTWPPVWTLRYEVLDGEAFGAWHYHLVNAAGHAPCGVTGTGSTGDAEQAEALRAIIGRTEGDATWCPTCLAVIADRLDRAVYGEHGELRPDSEGGNA